MNRPAAAALMLVCLTGALYGRCAQAAPPADHWVTVWSAAVHAPVQFPGAPPPLTVSHQTVREIIRPTLAGRELRLRLSNEFGQEPLTLGAVHVALLGQDGHVVAGTDRTVTFSGRRAARVPAGAPLLSDPIHLSVPAFASLAISLYLPDTARASTYHLLGQQATVIAGPGDLTGADYLPARNAYHSWYWLSDLEMREPAPAGTVVAFGDSITDGFGATAGRYQDWPDRLAARLAARGALPAVAVANEGIGGNRILFDGAGTSALARLDRDVLAKPGVKALIVLEGVNDIGWPSMTLRSPSAQGARSPFAAQTVSAGDLIAGLRQIIARAHTHGLAVLGATLTPYEGASYYTPAGEAVRETVNTWIRSSGAFDGVIDFDAALRDPTHPRRIRQALQSGDHLHPNAAGYQAMADAIDVAEVRQAMVHGPAGGERWVASWAVSEQLAVTAPDRPVLPAHLTMPDFTHLPGPRRPPVPSVSDDQTVRMIVHTSIGGRRIRIELSNAAGEPQTEIGEAHVAVRTAGSTIDPHTDRTLTFGGRRQVVIGPGQVVISDPVDLRFAPLADLAVSLYVTKARGIPTNHTPGLHTAYLSDGNVAAASSLPAPRLSTSYLWLRSVDVLTAADSFAIACLGDSITDGFGTTVNANAAWPALLAARLAARRGAVPALSVINAGISGNQVLRDGAGVGAEARFDRDVVGEPGVRWVVLLEGINDINIHGQIDQPGAVTAADLIAGYRQLIERAHAQGLKIMGATLTPQQGLWLAGPVGEATRQAVNHWIRTAGAFDALIDFDAVERDPADPARLLPAYDSGDHIHPNDAGNEAMARAFALDELAR